MMSLENSKIPAHRIVVNAVKRLGNVQVLGANHIAAFSPKLHG